MKSNHLFLILLGMFFQLFLISCETASLQKPVSDDLVIEPRNIEECDECPVDDCCCAVQLIDGTNVNVDLCGTSTPNKPTTPCSATIGPCSISGFIFTLPQLNNPPDTELFCVPQNGTFYLRSMDDGVVRVTCQVGQATPQSIDVTLPATRGFTVSGACALGPCQ